MSLLTIHLERDQTPLPAVPIIMNGITGITDDQGDVSRYFVSKAPVRIESGIPAVLFEPIEGLGLDLEGHSPITIAASVLVGPYGADSDQCEVNIGGERNIFLKYVNYSNLGLEVPVGGMNNFSRASVGNSVANPTELFAPGFNGFLTPIDRFLTEHGYEGTWFLFGREVPLRFPLSVCTDSGTAGDCSIIAMRDLKPIRDYFNAVFEHYMERSAILISRIPKDSKDYQHVDRWRRDFGARGAAFVQIIGRRLRRLSPPIFHCANPPPQCDTKAFPSPLIENFFERMIGRTPPRALRAITDLRKRDRRRLHRLLERYPQVYQRCP